MVSAGSVSQFIDLVSAAYLQFFLTGVSWRMSVSAESISELVELDHCGVSWECSTIYRLDVSCLHVINSIGVSWKMWVSAECISLSILKCQLELQSVSLKHLIINKDGVS